MADLTTRSLSSLRDLLQALNDYFSADAALPEFPLELTTAIANYIQVYEKSEGSHDSWRILEELRDLMAQNASRSDSRLPQFLKCLKELREVLRPGDVIENFDEWILRPLLQPYGKTRQMLTDARDVMLFCLIPQEEIYDARVSAMNHRLLDIYIQKWKDILQGNPGNQTLPAAKFTVATLEKILLDAGDKSPKEFLATADKYYLDKENRLIVSGLLCRFCLAHDHHLYRVLETPLFDHVLQCLEMDTSKSAVTVSLTVLVMFLPNVCNSISEQLPHLFFILYRMLCWGRPPKIPTDDGGVFEDATWPLGERREKWEVADSSHDLASGIGGPKADQLFTFLYGLFPVNLLNFVKAPSKYWQKHQMLVTSEDEEHFKSLAETLLARHTFNPDILKYTLESEVTDTSRWTEVESSEIATKCSSFDSANKMPPQRNSSSGTQSPRKPGRNSNSALSQSLDTEAARGMAFPKTDFMPPSWQRSRASGGLGSSFANGFDDISSSPLTVSSHLPTRPVRGIGAIGSIPTETVGFYGEEEAAKPREYAADAPFTTARSSTSDSASLEAKTTLESETSEAIASLQWELYLLQAQLETEQLLKGRYLQQIARLQRKQVLQATTDAELEHHITTIADLKRHVDELMEDLRRQQQSSAQYKQERAIVEEKLYMKIKTIGDEKNRWKDEASCFRLESERYQRENFRLRKAERKRDIEIAKSRQTSQEMLEKESSTTTSKIAELKAEIQDWKDKVAAHRDLESQNTKLEFNCKRLEMSLASANKENRTMSKQLRQLGAEKSANGVKPQSNQPKFRLFLDSVANTHANEISQLKDTHDALVKKYRELEADYRDLQVSMETEKREWFAKQRKITPLITEPPYPRLLDDSHSIETRTSKLSDPSSSTAPSEYASTVTSDGSRGDTIHESFVTGINSPVQHRPFVTISPTGDREDPFTTALPRRAKTDAGATSSKPVKIKPNSEIRFYGRGGAQNMGMKPKKKEKTGLQLG